MKGYRTVVFNLVMGVVMLVNQVYGTEIGEAQVGATIDALDAGLTGLWAIGNVVLRAVTNTAIFRGG